MALTRVAATNLMGLYLLFIVALTKKSREAKMMNIGFSVITNTPKTTTLKKAVSLLILLSIFSMDMGQITAFITIISKGYIQLIHKIFVAYLSTTKLYETYRYNGRINRIFIRKG